MKYFKKSKKNEKTPNAQENFDKVSLAQHAITSSEDHLYDRDGLRTGHNHDFMEDPRFLKAYKRGVKAVGIDYHWQWRTHIFLWAFSHAMKIEGDIVECGVYKGFMCSAAMTYVDWNKNNNNKRAFLFDTYKGLDVSLLNDDEKKLGRAEQFKDIYGDVYEEVLDNFSEYNNVKLIKGSVPSSLKSVKIKKIAFLALDMNNAKPEAEALKYFWPSIVSGGLCLMDDYAFIGYHPQKKALDKVARSFGVEIVSLPTGQGLLIKP